jgi:Cu/Ag efflux protein CusF
MTDKENEMKRIYATFVTSITLALLAPTAWAGGPTAASPGRVEGTIQSVDPAQQRIVLADGTELTVASPALLEQIEPGQKVNVQFVDEYGQKMVQRLEVMAP